MATETIQIKSSGMMCSFCTMSVEKALKKLPGVNNVLVNLVHRRRRSGREEYCGPDRDRRRAFAIDAC